MPANKKSALQEYGWMVGVGVVASALGMALGARYMRTMQGFSKVATKHSKQAMGALKTKKGQSSGISSKIPGRSDAGASASISSLDPEARQAILHDALEAVRRQSKTSPGAALNGDEGESRTRMDG